MSRAKLLILALAAYFGLNAACPSTAAAGEPDKKTEYHSRGPIELSTSTVPAESRLKMTVESAGIRCTIKDKAEEDGQLDDRPDFASIKEHKEDMSCRGEHECEPYIGNIFRRERDQLVKEHVGIYNAIVSGRMDGRVKVKQYQRLDLEYSAGSIKCNGAIKVTVTMPDGTVYEAKECKGDGVTDYFSVKKRDGSYVVRMRNDRSEAARKLIGKVVRHALQYHPVKKKDKLKRAVEKLDSMFNE